MSRIERVHPMQVKGSISAMASKSYLQRALVISSLAEESSRLFDVRWSEDGEAARDLICDLGARIETKEQVHIYPATRDIEKHIKLNVGESGLLLRMSAVVSNLFGNDILIKGKGSLLNRPVRPIIELLKALGIDASSENEKLPLHLKGKLKAGKIKVDGGFSSQLISGTLIALPTLTADTILEVERLKSKPYVDMTLDVMQHFGVQVEHEDYRIFHIEGGQVYKGSDYVIEGDWSAAANFLVAAAISGEIQIRGLTQNSLQADREIINALEDFGAQINFSDDVLNVKKDKALPFFFDATHCPDLFPPLVVLAAGCEGRSVLKGTDRLIHKESNRLETLLETFGKLGLNMEDRDNHLYIYGKRQLSGGVVHSFHDHRIAMAASIATTLSNGEIVIEGAEAVGKSYPEFFVDLGKIANKRV